MYTKTEDFLTETFDFSQFQFKLDSDSVNNGFCPIKSAANTAELHVRKKKKTKNKNCTAIIFYLTDESE